MLSFLTCGKTRAGGEQCTRFTARADHLLTRTNQVSRVESVALKGTCPSVQIRLESVSHR